MLQSQKKFPSKEVLQVYHSRERGSSEPVVAAYDVEVDLDSGGVGSTVGYKLDLGGEPVDGYRVFLGVPLDSVGDGEVLGLKYRMSGLGNLQEEDVVAQVRVRQYYEGGGASYYALLDWQNVEGEEQQLNIPIDRERMAAGGRTYVEWRFAKRGGGSGTFGDKKIDLRNIKAEEKKWGWYTKTVYSCEEEDNYRFGFNTQEKVNEVSGKGNHNTAMFWEYDTRLGRRWNPDPVIKPWRSRYDAFDNNPIWKMDPLGDDEYYNSGGKWIGSNGAHNNVRVMVTDDKQVKSIIKDYTKKGVDYSGEIVKPRMVPHDDILRNSLSVLKNASTIPLGEKWSVMNKNDRGGYAETATGVGQVYDPIKGKITSKGDPMPSGDVGIHNHPVGVVKSGGEIGSWNANKPSTNDDVKKGDYNYWITVGKDGELSPSDVLSYEEKGDPRFETTKVETKDDSYNINPADAQKMIDNDRGKLGKEYDKAKK